MTEPVLMLKPVPMIASVLETAHRTVTVSVSVSATAFAVEIAAVLAFVSAFDQ